MTIWQTLIVTVIGSFLGGAAITLVYTEWARRTQRHETSAHGLHFTVRPTLKNFDETRGFYKRAGIISIDTIGPGTKNNLEIFQWVDDQFAHKYDPGIPRLTNEHPTIELGTEYQWHKDSDEPSVSIGVGWPTPYKRGFRHQFARYNYATKQIEEWRWVQLFALRQWWNRKERFGIPFSGRQRPLGKWEPRTSSTLEWAGPTSNEHEDPNSRVHFRVTSQAQEPE